MMQTVSLSTTVEDGVLVIRIPLKQFGAESNKFPFELDLKPFSQGFEWSWPSGRNHYDNALSGRATWRGRTYEVRIGEIVLFTAGRDRRYLLVMINGYPTLHFVEGDDGRYASIITQPGSRATVRSDSNMPTSYADADLTFADYHDVVQGPGASRGRAVVVDGRTDYGPMVRHAILRWEGRQPDPEELEQSE